MSINIPSNPAPTGYITRPQEYTDALAKAQALLDQETDPANEDSWQSDGEREGVELHRKPNPDNPNDVPLVKGKVLIENATPEQVLAAVQLPGVRKKWDSRIEDGFAVQRYSPQSYLFYSVMKSPSYFIWARDICGVQENKTSADGSLITVLQTSVDNEEFIPDAGSYAKSRTRATVELSGWKFEKKGDDTELTYIVKILLNGNIPTAIVSSIAAETPMCCARIRDSFYSTGYAPYEIYKDNPITCNQTQSFEDGDGSEAQSGEKKWTGSFRGFGADTLEIAYDSERMYPSGINVEVTGEGADSVSASVDESASRVIVKVEEGAKDKDFEVIITPQ